MECREFPRTLTLAALAALPLLLSGCEHGTTITIDGDEGKPLSELNLSGTPPHRLVLLGPDAVEITKGDKLAITVSGDQADDVRFTLKDGTLGVLRKSKVWSGNGGAKIKVTMPAPDELVMTGSGTITADALASKAKVNIVGSGNVVSDKVSAEKLVVVIAGSGTYRGGGIAKALKLDIVGSGSAEMAGLKADTAKVVIGGSGNAAFASDGPVRASIMGSGSIKVTGRATCTVSAMGSGKLVCEPGSGPVTKIDDAYGKDSDADF
jgi:hypothetical protein